MVRGVLAGDTLESYRYNALRAELFSFLEALEARMARAREVKAARRPEGMPRWGRLSPQAAHRCSRGP